MLRHLAFLFVLTCVRAQFMLVWNTGPVTPPTTLGYTNCVDKIDNCKAYGKDNCQAPYDVWAKKNCPNFCGYCIGPSTPAPPCRNTISNCDDYSKSVCQDPDYKSWAEDKCRYYCRLCPANQLANMDAHTTTPSPADCVDKVDCRLYGQVACTDSSYAKWTKSNCPAYCKLCVGVATPAPACMDKIPNCANYPKDTCTSSDYTIWVQENCRKHCGLCGSGAKPNYPVPVRPGRRAVENNL